MTPGRRAPIEGYEPPEPFAPPEDEDEVAPAPAPRLRLRLRLPRR